MSWLPRRSARLGAAAWTPFGRLRLAPRSLLFALARLRLRAVATPASFLSRRAVQSCFAGRVVARASPSGLLFAPLRLAFGRCGAAFPARASCLLASLSSASPARSTRNGPPLRPPYPPMTRGANLQQDEFTGKFIKYTYHTFRYRQSQLPEIFCKR